jgi:hypothetical protein
MRRFETKNAKSNLLLGLVLLLISPDIYSQTMQQIFEENKSSVVMINTEYESGAGIGTGFFINEFATVLTCFHVVKDATNISVIYNNKAYEADILEYWTEQDVALLLCRIEERTPYVKVNPGYDHRNEYLPNILDPILAVGFPLGLGLSANEGKISASYAYSDDLPDLIVLQSDIAINPGNSGGPVFNDKGIVIGIAQSKINIEAVSGMNFIYSIDWLINSMPFIFEANAQYMFDKYGGCGFLYFRRFPGQIPIGLFLLGLHEEFTSPRRFSEQDERQDGYQESNISTESFSRLSLADSVIYNIFMPNDLNIDHIAMDGEKINWRFMYFNYGGRQFKLLPYNYTADGRILLSQQARIMKKYAGYFLNKSQNQYVRERVNRVLNLDDEQKY